METKLNNKDGNAGTSRKSNVNEDTSNSSIPLDYATNPLANELVNGNTNSNVNNNSINTSGNEKRVLSTPFLMLVIMSYGKLYSIIY